VNHEKQATSQYYDATRVEGLLQAAATLPGVARIFVNPVIKKSLCTSVKGDRRWLRRLRPWFGHDEHFHLRMRCPAQDEHCENQAPPPAGDGCEELDWWLDPEAQAERAKRGKTYSKRVGAKPTLPEPCQAVLKAKAATSTPAKKGDASPKKSGK